ncbi:hypothetical protein H4R99_000855 [Coemansia sp. RSA 1722]|nr:hypothetical protein LPJ57_000909 [Coemansia sp. RSA 486]KAJ2234717.1 hypothetical protein IWW45_003183 [Coemansia sp. RSA 485]KAJ2598714.1 hypothetical protein GGF39_002537 [Coemansia sp. RSA 1721]KAJ2605761.1 hypothetical protein H4R99_000855 [Coemansia sp. RSA 1722]KAJ2637065.1 hypothetical protein GGF40_002611 [Coemansia sp. RSA 1286]
MPDEQRVIPAALAKALSDKLYDKQRAATLKIERLVLDALEADDEKRIYSLIAELSTDFATSEKESARIGGLVALAATAVALTHINIRPFLPHMVPPMVSALSDGESKVRYFACESLYNVAKVSRGSILRWFNDVFDGLARVTADSVKTVKDGADYLDRLFKDIVAEQAATCLDWYDSGQSDNEVVGRDEAEAGVVDGNADDAADEREIGGFMAEAPRRGSTDSHNIFSQTGGSADKTRKNVSEAHQHPPGSVPEDESQSEDPKQRRGPRLAFSLEKFVPLLAERMHTYKPSTRLYLIEWIRVLDSVPGLDLIVYLPEFFDGLLRFLSDPSDDVRNRTQSLLGELLNEIRECVEMQGIESDDNDGGALLHMEDEFADDDSASWSEEYPRVSRARVRSSTMQSAVHAEGRFADDLPPRQHPLGVQSRQQQQQQHLSLSRRPSRAPSAAGSISGTRNMPVSSSVTGGGSAGLAHFYHSHPSDRPHSRTGSRAHLHVRSGSGVDGTTNRSAASIMSSALASGQLHGVSDELRMAARRKKIRAERASNALIPGASVVINFARCVDILIPHLESNDQEIQGTALGWVLQFTWLCPQVIVQFVPRLVNAVLPSVSHPMPTHRHTAEDVNLQLYELVSAAPDPVKRVADDPKQGKSAREVDDQCDNRQQKHRQRQNSLLKENAQWASSVPSEIGAKPTAARPLPPVTSTATAAVGNMTRPQSPSLSAYSVASVTGQPLAVRSRAGSLLQATSASPAPSSLAATPSLQPADKAAAIGSRPQSPPAAVLHPAPVSVAEVTAGIDGARVSADHEGDNDAGSAGEQPCEPSAEAGTSVIEEPFNYEHAATAIMELFAKNVHEPTKVCGMQWLLLLHRKAPWRILTPEDMSFPVLLKMLSDSSEQVIKLDLQLFAQIALYSQNEQKKDKPELRASYDVDPREMPYLSRFFGSLLQMFATDRVLLETRAALMVRQLCVVLDPELVFCLFARLLTLPRFSVDCVDHRQWQGREHAMTGSDVDLAARVSGNDYDDAKEPGYAVLPEAFQQIGSAEPDILETPVASASDVPERMPSLESINAASTTPHSRRPTSGIDAPLSEFGDDFSDGNASDHADEYMSDHEGTRAYADGSELDSLVDLEFVGIMVQHLSWILVTAPETAKLRLVLRRYSVQLAAYSQAPGLASIRGAITGAAARSAASGRQQGRASGSAAAAAAAAAVGGRRRGASTAGAKEAATAAENVAQQAKPSKLVRASTGAGNAAFPAAFPAAAAASVSVRGNGGSGVAGGSNSNSSSRDATRPQQKHQQQAARNAQQLRKAKHVLAQAVARIQRDVDQNELSHGLFVSLFRAWSYNPASCLTLCLLSQHYEISALLIHAFGELPQDMTVSFLVQLDKLVQLIESPVFTFLRLQLLDPLQHPLLVRTLYGLLMMLPQSSAFAILRNRLSTVAMLPMSGPGVAELFQQGRAGVASASLESDAANAGAQQDALAGAAQTHYHYHCHYHPPGCISAAGDINCVSAGSVQGSAAGASGQLGGALGIQPCDLHELIQLLTAGGKRQMQGETHSHAAEQKLASAASILQQLAELQIYAGGDMVSLGANSIGCCGCACHGAGSSSAGDSSANFGASVVATKLVEMYRGIRRRYAQALARSHQTR